MTVSDQYGNKVSVSEKNDRVLCLPSNSGRKHVLDLMRLFLMLTASISDKKN